MIHTKQGDDFARLWRATLVAASKQETAAGLVE